jgi:Tfp pilus assembly protein PilW
MGDEPGMHMTRLRDERGTTLPELLTAIVIALIVSLAGFALIETSMSRAGETAARVDTAQRSRTALDVMTRELRSQVCVTRSDPSLMTSARSVYAATGTSITFFADTADESWRTGVTTMPVATLRTLVLNGTTLTETIVAGVNDGANPGAVTFTYSKSTTTGTQRRQLLSNVFQLQQKVGATTVITPIFRYYAFDNSSPPEPKLPLDPGPTGLTEAQLQSIAKISITYAVSPSSKSAGVGTTVLQDDVFVRTADPNVTTPKPTCS